MNRIIQFFVPGIPGTAGSKRFVGIKGGRGIIIDASGKKGKEWRQQVAAFARDAMADKEVIQVGAIKLAVKFFMPFRKSDLRKDGTVKDTAPLWHTVKPDATKLLRAIEDSLTGIVWRDDAQIAVQSVSKTYAMSPGAAVLVTLLEEEEP